MKKTLLKKSKIQFNNFYISKGMKKNEIFLLEEAKSNSESLHFERS